MANPSLQIGNSNWAIKEDNLLGYSTAGTRFVPQPITMTRASAGTRVNSSGLVETVELLGSELVSDSDFILTGTQAEETTGTYWTTGTDWSISGGAATLSTASGSSSLSSSNMTVTVGKIYKVTINVSATSTGFRLYDALGVVSYGLSLGENVFYRTPSSPTYTVTPLGLAGATGTISNVSVKEYTANNLARVDYDGTASSLLVEPERTNLITYSSDFTDSSWTNVGATVTPNSATSPDGTLNASSIELTSGLYMYFTYNTTINIGDTYTWSCFVKSSSIKINWGGGTPDGTDINTIEALSNGWYRQVLQRTFTTTGAGMQAMFAESVAGAGLFDVWGAQIEEGYATSYIPTDGGTVTRVKDQYSKTGISNLINSEEGVLFLEIAYLSETDPLLLRLSINDGTNNNRIIIQTNQNSNQMQFYLINSSGVQTSSFYTLPNKTNFNKIAFKWKVNDFAVWSNGVEVITDASGTTFSSGILDRVSFEGATGSHNFYGKVKKLQVFKTALTDSELATLTTQ